MIIDSEDVTSRYEQAFVSRQWQTTRRPQSCTDAPVTKHFARPSAPWRVEKLGALHLFSPPMSFKTKDWEIRYALALTDSHTK